METIALHIFIFITFLLGSVINEMLQRQSELNTMITSCYQPTLMSRRTSNNLKRKNLQKNAITYNIDSSIKRPKTSCSPIQFAEKTANISNLAKRCLSEDPANRPRAKQLMHWLSNFMHTNLNE